jgi:hypothetical protein
MKKRKLHGLDSDFQLDESTCASLKVDQFLSLIPAQSWIVVKDLVNAFINYHGDSMSDPLTAFSRICGSLDTISKKRRKHLALHSYCNDVLRYLRQKQVKTNFGQSF